MGGPDSPLRGRLPAQPGHLRPARRRAIRRPVSPPSLASTFYLPWSQRTFIPKHHEENSADSRVAVLHWGHVPGANVCTNKSLPPPPSKQGLAQLVSEEKTHTD